MRWRQILKIQMYILRGGFKDQLDVHLGIIWPNGGGEFNDSQNQPNAIIAVVYFIVDYYRLVYK